MNSGCLQAVCTQETFMQHTLRKYSANPCRYVQWRPIGYHQHTSSVFVGARLDGVCDMVQEMRVQLEHEAGFYSMTDIFSACHLATCEQYFGG